MGSHNSTGLNHLEEKINMKFKSLEEKFDVKFESFDEKSNVRIESFEKSVRMDIINIEDKSKSFDEKLKDLQIQHFLINSRTSNSTSSNASVSSLIQIGICKIKI